MREPLEFDFNNPEERLYKHNEMEYYKLRLVEGGVVQLAKIVKDQQWQETYALRYPLEFKSQEDIEQSYRDLMNAEKTSIRDDVLLAGLVTDTGRKGIVHFVKQ